MRPRPVGLAVLLVAGMAVALAARPHTSPSGQQVFRAGTDEITVDVSVRSGGDRVGGLSAKDFVLTDNGVPQQIDTVDASVVPVDVTVLVDTNREVDDETDDVVRQATRMAGLLRPTDRLRVWDISSVITEVTPLGSVGPTPVPALAGGGLASVYDALGAALMEPVIPDGRHLVVAITNGIDTDSVLTLPTVQALADRSNATLHVSQLDVVEDPPDPRRPGAWWHTSREALRGTACGHGNCEPNAGFFQPHYTPARIADRFDPLAQIATSTGGKLHTLGLIVEHNAADVFVNAFKDFQENYLLRYRPQGVDRLGWHAIAVTVPGFPGYVIHARRGYSIEATPALAAPSAAVTMPAPQPSAVSARPPVDAIVRHYEAGEYDEALTAAVQMDPLALISQVWEAGDLWPTAPHREAVLTLELARIALIKGLQQARKPVGDWLAAESRFVRDPTGPDAFEHEWVAAELDLLEAALRPDDAARAARTALERFPGDPRFLLDAALLADQRWTVGSPAVLSAGQAAKQVADVLAKYDAVVAHQDAPDLVAEARVRSAWILHRAAQDTDALTRLEAVNDADADLPVKYLHHLFQGHVLTSLGRAADAVTEYRAAVALVPTGEAARVALMNGLIAAGDWAGALVLSDNIQATPTTIIDPWHLYWEGNYRHYPEAIAHLRELVR